MLSFNKENVTLESLERDNKKVLLFNLQKKKKPRASFTTFNETFNVDVTDTLVLRGPESVSAIRRSCTKDLA